MKSYKTLQRIYKAKYYFLTVCLLVVFSASAQLNRVEKKIIQQVQDYNQESIDFLEKLVNINSGTLNSEGIKKVGMVLEKEFQAIEFDTRWIDMPSKMNRAGHLFASKKGSKGKRILLIGHIDTVFEADSPFQNFEIIEGKVYGPGANDMKGGDVIMLYALKALYDLKLLDKASITVAYTGDEESSGKPLSISRKDLIEAAKSSDIALGFENSTGFNYATVARRGSSGWTLEVKGERAHSSSIFSERTGAGAIFEMSRILNEFYINVKGETYLTFNPGLLLGGTFVEFDSKQSKGEAFGKSNVVAQTAIVKGGLRFISEDQKNRAREEMKAIVKNNLPLTSASIKFTDSYPAMGPTEGNTKLLKKLNQVSIDMGQDPVLAYDPGKRGAADVSFVAKYVDCLDGLGTMGTGAHTLKETVNLETMNLLIQRTAVLIYRLINESD
ncbi:MAG: M20/M25/M40 family metallo-hydrolase [Flavobacteriaceae bacterium]|nr:M20/M25/M40 family metallo-hydrolase [Flavobacteriaceae bacterium]